MPHIHCQINHTHLREHDHSFSLSLCLFRQPRVSFLTFITFTGTDLQSCQFNGTLHRKVLSIETHVQMALQCATVLRKTCVNAERDFLDVTGRGCVTVAISFSHAL